MKTNGALEPRFSSVVILVRSSPSGIYFLIRGGEEESSFATIALNYPGMPVETVGRGGDFVLVRLAREPGPEEGEEEPPPSICVVALPIPEGRPGSRAGEPDGC